MHTLSKGNICFMDSKVYCVVVLFKEQLIEKRILFDNDNLFTETTVSFGPRVSFQDLDRETAKCRDLQQVVQLNKWSPTTTAKHI